MSNANNPWNRVSAWYDERPVRERGLILATVAVLVLLAGWQFWIEPALVTAERHEAELADVRSEQAQLLATQADLERQLSQDPSAQLRQTLEARERRLDRIDQQITETTGQLIPPRDMVVMLQDMLATEKGLSLEAVQLLAPRPIYAQEPSETQDDAEPEALLYAHEVDIVVAGGYLETMKYLERLEAMDERLGWVMVEYEAAEWPEGSARIRVRTLSLEPAWLGV
ncbi:type II secretion system protein GspM [Marinobacter lacisalsi]|uniref:Type II secretion system protein GspM n=1 Tax=Marinobacter lacisalsi TaxID=475979 RepID=A0ABV8QFS0_9GAMM